MKRSGVRPSVRLSHHSTAAAACGGFAAERRAGDIDRQRRRRAPSSSGAAARRSTANASSIALTWEDERRLVKIKITVNVHVRLTEHRETIHASLCES